MKTIMITLVIMMLAFGCFVAGGKYLQNQFQEMVENSQLMKAL